ncbi:hypothetical protein AB0B45_23930 [Nonomuraea sp. NPDC049152]|uniref:hypothetical protein n=1 Tax=Nonomuraea sp. NPDC049152 TaxID=3154350 RepID=UPI0033E56B02
MSKMTISTGRPGAGLCAPTSLFAVLQAGGGAAALGLVLTASILTFIVVIPVAGVLADRVPRMTIISTCQLTCALTQLIAASVVMTGMAHTWSPAVLAAATGAVSACFQPAVKGIVPQLVDPEDLVPALWDGVTFLASAAVFATLRLPPAGLEAPGNVAGLAAADQSSTATNVPPSSPAASAANPSAPSPPESKSPSASSTRLSRTPSRAALETVRLRLTRSV